MLGIDPHVHLQHGRLRMKEFLPQEILATAYSGPLTACEAGSVNGDLNLAAAVPFIVHPEMLKNCDETGTAIAVRGRANQHHWDVLRTIKAEFDRSTMEKTFRENKPCGIASVQSPLPYTSQHPTIEQGILLFIGNRDEIMPHLRRSKTFRHHMPGARLKADHAVAKHTLLKQKSPL